MPPSKGKTSSATTRNKRSHRHTTVSRSKVKRKGKKKTVAELIPNKFYKIREILEKNSKSGKYLIDWEDDPVTKEKFPQTWETEHFLNAEALAYWKSKESTRKQNKQDKPLAHTTVRKSRGSDSIETSPAQRKRRVIDRQNDLTGPTENTDRSSVLLPKSEYPQSAVIATRKTPADSRDPQYSLYSSSPLLVPANQAASESVQSLPYPSISTERGVYQFGSAHDSQSVQGIFDHAPLVERRTNGTLAKANEFEAAHSYVASYPKSSRLDVPLDSSPISTDSSARDPSSQRSSVTTVSGPDWQSKGSREDLSFYENSNSVHNQPNSAQAEDISHLSSEAEKDPIVKSYSSEDPFELFTNESPIADSVTLENSFAAIGPKLAQSQENTLSSAQYQIRSSSISSLVDHPTARGITSRAPVSLTYLEAEELRKATKQDHQFWRSEKGVVKFVPSVSKKNFPGRNDSRETSILSREKSVERVESASSRKSLILRLPIAKLQVLANRTKGSEHGVSLSALSQRSPNSQPEKALHLVQFKESTIHSSIEQSDYSTEETPNSAYSQNPSKYSEVIHSNAPPRPLTSSNSAMSDKSATSSILRPQPRSISATPGRPSIREKLRSMRAASNAIIDSPRIARQSSPSVQSSKSPSVIPQPAPAEPVGNSRLEVQSMEIPLPLHDPDADSSIPMHPSNPSLRQESSPGQIIRLLDPPSLGEMEFIIPLPAPARVRDQYVHTINHHRKVITEFCGNDTVDDRIIFKIRDLLKSLDNISTHLDLENDSINTEHNVSPEDEVTWAKSCSGKFQFLDHLIAHMRYQDAHIVIVAQGGRSLDIIEGFLKGLHVGYERPDILADSDRKTTQGRLQFSLIASGEEESSALLRAANLVIAFDGSFNAAEDQIKELRSHMLNIGQLTPVIHLMIFASSEHVERCLPDSIGGFPRMRTKLSFITHIRQEVGELVPGEYAPVHAAEEVMEFVKAGGLEGQWILPSVRPLEIDGIESVESTQDKNGVTLPGVTISEGESMLSQAIRKRSLDSMEDGTASPKRQRLTPAPDVEQRTDLTSQESQKTADELRNALQALQEANTELVNLKAFHANQETSLKDRIAEMGSRLGEHADALGELQRRYEKRNEAYHILRHEMAESVAASAVLERKREAQAVEIRRLQEDRRGFEVELQECRLQLLTSVVPQTADLERARMEARNAIHEAKMLNQRISSLHTDFEFVRGQYQAASTAAASSATRIQELEAMNVILTQKASGEAVRLREVNNDNASTMHLARIRELEAIVEDREELLRKKEREKRERGVQTRSGSVQRERGSRAGSRAASPMPGLLGVGVGVGDKRGSGLRFGLDDQVRG